MADVKICDRCGKTIATTAAQTFGFATWRYSIFNLGAPQRTHTEWDLCIDCGDMLEKFLSGFDPNEKPDDALINAG